MPSQDRYVTAYHLIRIPAYVHDFAFAQEFADGVAAGRIAVGQAAAARADALPVIVLPADLRLGVILLAYAYYPAVVQDFVDEVGGDLPVCRDQEPRYSIECYICDEGGKCGVFGVQL